MTTLSLAGKAAIVTGAGSGIGRAISIAFARAAAAVVCLDVQGSTAEATAREIDAAGGRAAGFACDVSREADTSAAAAAAHGAFGAVRILVNAAASDDPNGTTLDITAAQWERVIAVNLTGAFLMTKAVLPQMMTAGGGSIIHIASQLGRVAAPARPAYCASKGALIQLAKAMAIDHAAQNIRVNTLSPGAVETRRMILRYGSMDEARRQAGPKHLVMRLWQPEEIAEAALFLASDAASFVTGSDMLVDGGYTAI